MEAKTVFTLALCINATVRCCKNYVFDQRFNESVGKNSVVEQTKAVKLQQKAW